MQADEVTVVHEVRVHQLIGGENRRWDEVGSMPTDLHDELFATEDPIPEADEMEIDFEVAMQASWTNMF